MPPGDASTNLQHPKVETLTGQKTAVLTWLILALFVLGIIAYWLPWIDHQTAALKLSGQDLGEFVKFIPRIRRGEMRFPRQVFYLPPFVGSVALVLLSATRRLAYPRIARVAMLALALLVLPGLLPPVWGHPRDLIHPEFRLQAVALLTGVLFVLAHGLLRNVPLYALGLALCASAFIALVPVQWAFWTVRPYIWAVYNTPTIRIGSGLVLEIGAWAGALSCSACLLCGIRPSASRTETGVHT